MLLTPHFFAASHAQARSPRHRYPELSQRDRAVLTVRPSVSAAVYGTASSTTGGAAFVLCVRLLLVALLAGGTAGSMLLMPQAARAGVFEEIGKEVNEIYKRTSPAIIKVRSEGVLTLAGSGFFIDDKGTILTADAILGANRIVTVDYKGVRMQAQILGRDRRSGMAMLHIDATGTPALTFAKTPDMGPGKAVIIIGYPLNMAAAPSFGFVSGSDFRYMNRIFATTHIRAAVPILPGQVGGPMLDTHGEVVGMVMTAIDDGKGVYALPGEAMTKILNDFHQFKEGRHGWVGVGVTERKGEDGRTHISISHLYDGTPALTSGLKPGDEVLRINSRKINSAGDVLDASFFSQVGQPITVTVIREGKEISCQFTLEARPSAMPSVAAGTPAPPSSDAQPAPAQESAPDGNTPAPVAPEGSGSSNGNPQASPSGNIATGPDAPASSNSGTGDGGAIPISSPGTSTNAPEPK